MEREEEKLTFRFAPPEGDKLEFARPIPHPWLRERMLTEIGIFDGQIARVRQPLDPADLEPFRPQDAPTSPEWNALLQANDRLSRMLRAGAPENLTAKASANLEQRVKDFLDALLVSRNLLFGDNIIFSGKSVLAPGIDLRSDQVGIAEEMVWTLFGPLVTRRLGDAREVEKRTARAEKALDEILARSWVIINRAPTFIPTALLAFHPVRVPGDVIRLHPLACVPMNGDFDGDQAAVFLPITEEGQREAGELLSLAAHLRRDPALIKWLYPNHEMLYGLALLSLAPKGLDEISELAGAPVAAPQGFVTRDSVTDALRAVLERDGAEAALEAAERLMSRGFEVAKESGASISPFIGATLSRPPEPMGDDAESWNAYAEELADAVASRSDFASSDIGPQLLAVKCGARGSIQSLTSLVGARGAVTDVHGKAVPIRHGYRDGLTFEETMARVVGAREGLGRTAEECMSIGYGVRQGSRSNAFTALARATRAERPGVVFARAAAAGEVDPLVDLDSRLFVGLRAKR
jgi:DNA-directed RNA polymerase beta' subunit